MSHKTIILGYAVIVVATLLLWLASGKTEDAKAGYQGSIMMGEVMAIVVGLFLACVWTVFWLPERVLHLLGMS